MSSCLEIRNRLLRQAPAAGGSATGQPRHEAVTSHLDACAACSAFAVRLDAVRGGLRAHHAGVEPDLAFASRVRARLSGDASAALGLAALRLLPVTAALLLVLLGFSLASLVGRSETAAGTGTTLAATDATDPDATPEEQWVAWVLRVEEEATP
jgi:hypothetical protein